MNFDFKPIFSKLEKDFYFLKIIYCNSIQISFFWKNHQNSGQMMNYYWTHPVVVLIIWSIAVLQAISKELTSKFNGNLQTVNMC